MDERRRIVGEATTTVAASPAEVIEFVLDLERYKRADHKIGKVGRVEQHGTTGTAEFSGRILGLPAPGGIYAYERTDRTLRFTGPVAGPARLAVEFEGTFDCVETEHGTEVTHREIYAFKAPGRWVLNPLLRGWFERDTIAEMDRFQQELGPPTGG